MFTLRTLFAAICVFALMAGFIAVQQEVKSITKLRNETEWKKQVLNEYFIKDLLRTPNLIGTSANKVKDISDLADFVFDYTKESSDYNLPHRVELLTEESRELSEYKEMLDERGVTLKSKQIEGVKFYWFQNRPTNLPDR